MNAPIVIYEAENGMEVSYDADDDVVCVTKADGNGLIFTPGEAWAIKAGIEQVLR